MEDEAAAFGSSSTTFAAVASGVAKASAESTMLTVAPGRTGESVNQGKAP